MMPTRPTMRILSGALVLALTLTACGGNGDQPGDPGDPGDPGGPATQLPQDEFDEAMSTPTDLVFWTWVNDIQNQVDLFEEAYPEINVEVVHAGQGGEQYQQLRTALEAGTGAPDLAQIEFQHLSSFRITQDLLDLSPYVGDIQDLYPDWVWAQVYQDGGLWGIPQDTGPMGTLYRNDLFEEAGIELPGTWDEFTQAAETYRQAFPDSYITNMPGNNPGQLIGLFWQNGAQPFGYDGQETVKIDLDSAEVLEVVDYWADLIDRDLVSVDPDFNDQWYQGLANDKYASWLVAAWGPLFLQGTVANTSGLWRAGELPQWAEGESVSGNWGGSTNAVLRTTENPIAAAELARFINVEHEPAMKFATEQFLFPATTAILESEEFITDESEFYGGQRVNEEFARIAETVSTDFGWLPFTDYAYASYNETLGNAIAEKGDLRAGLEAWEADLEQYAQSQGFTIE